MRQRTKRTRQVDAMKLKHSVFPTVLVCVVMVACIAPRPTPTISPLHSPLALQAKTPTPVPTPAGGMIFNSSFEEPYYCEPAFCVPHGWIAWRENPPHCRPDSRPGRPPCDIPCPSTCERSNGSCDPDTGCYWAAPEFSAATLQFYYRVHSGRNAVKIFSSGRMWDAGLYQQVYHMPLNSRLTFSVWAHAWQCFSWDNCQFGRLSDQPANMNISVGIDPYGGTVPTSTHVIWTVGESFDVYRQFSVTTTALNQVVTVFIRGAPRWMWSRGNGNDLYVDDARLTVVEMPVLTERVYLPIVEK